MSAIGEKQAEFSGKITSVTIRDTGSEVNVEANVGSFGMVFGTVAFGPAVDAAGETGPVTVRGPSAPSGWSDCAVQWWGDVAQEWGAPTRNQTHQC